MGGIRKKFSPQSPPRSGWVRDAEYAVNYFCKTLRSLRLCGKQFYPRNPRKRRLLVTTKTEEKAIAPAASIGLRNPRAAAGIRIML